MDEVRAEVVPCSTHGAMVAVAAMALFLFGCGDAAPRKSEAAQHPPGYVVDSIFPPEEMLRRFRVGLDSPTAFQGATSRDALVHQFFAALRRKDRSAIEALALDRAAFAYLVFPVSRWSQPPYRQPPAIAWKLFQANSNGRLSRLLSRLDRFEFMGYRCPQPMETDGPLTLWGGCLTQVRESGKNREIRLFGTIIERDGRFKFAGFNNDF